MIIRSPDIALLAAGLAALVGYGDTLGLLTVISYVHEAGQTNDARHGALVGMILSLMVPALVLTIAFVSGVVVGSLTGHRAGVYRRQAVLSLVTLLFLAASLLDATSGRAPALLLMAIAMGAIHAVLQDVPTAVIGFFEVVGRVGERLARVVGGEQSLGLPADLLLLIALIMGIASGAFLYPQFGLTSLWLAALTAGLLAAWSTMLKPKTTA